MPIIRTFGPFRIDISAEILFRGAEPLPVGRRAVALLRALIERPGMPVSKDALIEAAWPGLAVEESNLTVQIASLRRVLGEEPSAERWIETLPRRGYRFVGLVATEENADESAPPPLGTPSLALPDKPSIAVLPFENLSGDTEQDYFADGIAEDIITGLSRFRQLFVIARNSSFIYKGSSVDVKQLGRELGVRYVLEGSVRKASNRVRITGQLIDAATGLHLWADRFDGTFGDIFDLQDYVTEAVVAAIAPKVVDAEIERSKRKPTGNLDAYDYFLRGMAEIHPRGYTPRARAAAEDALRMFRKAIEIDPDFASAYGLAAWCYVRLKAIGWGARADRLEEIAEAARLARLAVELGKDDAMALSSAAHVLAYVVGDYEASSGAIERAVALNSNLAMVWYCGGWVRLMLAQPEAAIESFARYTRLSPLDPFTPYIHAGTAFAYFCREQYEIGLSWAEKSLEEYQVAHVFGAYAANAILAGRVKEAQAAIARWREIDPVLRVDHLKDLFPIRNYSDKVVEALRTAGVPE
jgi:TolB-like protein